jgi:hypothetical protein
MNPFEVALADSDALCLMGGEKHYVINALRALIEIH